MVIKIAPVVDHVSGEEVGDLVNEFTCKSIERGVWYSDSIKGIRG